MCSHFFSINCSTKDNEKLCKHFAEIALSFSCVLLSSLFFTPSSFRVFEFARVCVCVCAWFECCSFVADSWNDTNCYHCAPLSLWKLTTTTEKIHNSWGANTRFPVFSEGHLKGRWNDSHEWWIQNCSPPSQKPPRFNQCWRCLLSWTHALLLSFYHSNRKCTYWLEFQYIQPGTARGRKEHGS